MSQIKEDVIASEEQHDSLHKIRIFNRVIGFRFWNNQHAIVMRFMVAHVAETIGVLNVFKNTTFQCFFYDGDNTFAETIKDLRYIMNGHSLGDIFIFESAGKEGNPHYNAICCDLVEQREIRNMVLSTWHCDARFVYVYLRDGKNAIRITPKFNKTAHRPIKLKYILKGDNTINKKHRGLLTMLSFEFPEIKNRLKEYQVDNSTEQDLLLRKYDTVSW